MTVAPHHPPVRGYEGADPYEIVSTKWGTMERWRAISLSTGEVSALAELGAQIRNDSAAIVARQDAREAVLNARQDALADRERQIGVMAAQVAEMAGRISVEWDRLQKARADQAEDPLPQPPGELSPGDLSPGDERNKEPEPSLELEGDNVAGTSPASGDPAGEFLRLTSPVTTDQIEFPGGEPEDHEELPKPPLAAGLDDNTEEEPTNGN